jgi:nucleotide-binding universal stress UspA family protein
VSRPVLVGFDPKTRDYAPVHFGIAVSQFTRAPLIVASVQAGTGPIAVSAGQTLPYAVAGADEDLVLDCSPALEPLEQDLAGEGIAAECRALTGTSVAGALHAAAEAENAALLVVGSTRRGAVGRVLPGSTAERLLHGAPCPVAVVPRRWTRNGAPETIGVAFADTPEGHEALRSAHALARRAGAKLRVLTVVRVTLTRYAETEAKTAARRAKYLEDVLGEHQRAAVEAARRAVASLDGDVDAEVDGFVGDPAETLVRVSEHLDLLVCGSRGYGPLRAVLLGGVSRRVVDEARCPVIVLPRGVKSSLEALVADAPEATAPISTRSSPPSNPPRQVRGAPRRVVPQTRG